MKNIVHRGGAGLLSEISSKYDRHRTEYIEHATESADYADELWNERYLNKKPGRTNLDGSQVNAVDPKKVDTCTRHNCK
jgi:hypothetical protein